MPRPYAPALCVVPALCALLAACADPLGADRAPSPTKSSAATLAGDRHAEVSQPPVLPGETLSLDEAVRIAITHSPRLQGAAARVDAAGARATQAGLAPNPTLALGIEGLGAEAGRGGETLVHVEQEIPLAGRLRRARRVAESDRDAAEAAGRATHVALAAGVARSYGAAAAAEQRLRCREHLVALAADLVAAVGARVDAGAAIEPDRVRAELVVEQAELDLETARLDVMAARRALGAAMGLDSPVESVLTAPPEPGSALPDFDTLAAGALRANGGIEQARLAVERARRTHDLARAEAAPGLSAAIGPRYSDADGETTLDLGIGLELPFFDRNQGAIRAAMADRLSAASDLREAQISLLGELSETWAAYESSRLTVARYEGQLLPKAERSLALARDAYAAGKADYLRLLDAQQVLVESQLLAIEARGRALQAAATLRELAGISTPWQRDTPPLGMREDHR